MKVLFSNLSFGRAFDSVQDNPDTRGMRLPSWKEDVIIRCQMPDENSKMTAPYLYVESRFGRVPWKETMIEMFSKEWQLVDIGKNDETKTELYEHINGNCGGSYECENKNLKFKKINGEKVKDDNVDETLANFIMYLHWLGYDLF